MHSYNDTLITRCSKNIQLYLYVLCVILITKGTFVSTLWCNKSEICTLIHKDWTLMWASKCTCMKAMSETSWRLTAVVWVSAGWHTHSNGRSWTLLRLVFNDMAMLINAYIWTFISVKIGYQGVNFIISACIWRKLQLHDNSTEVICM